MTVRFRVTRSITLEEMLARHEERRQKLKRFLASQNWSTLSAEEQMEKVQTIKRWSDTNIQEELLWREGKLKEFLDDSFLDI